MAQIDPFQLAPYLKFNPDEGTVVCGPLGDGPGYWAGAPGVMYSETHERFYLVYRLRRPRGVEPDRGAEIRIAQSTDGIAFEDIWSGTKDLLDTTSIERCALDYRPDTGWRMYVSYVDPGDRRWLISLIEADRPEDFDLRSVRPILTAADLGVEGVKDPFLFDHDGLRHMVVSFAVAATPGSTADDMHGTDDAYNTGLIQSATGLATSGDGVEWQWQGPILAPAPGAWDAYAARINTVWRQGDTWLGLYDGSADVSENYEERCGLAYSTDLRTFHRTTLSEPLYQPLSDKRALRYFNVVRRDDRLYTYYEMSREDGSHDLRVMCCQA